MSRLKSELQLQPISAGGQGGAVRLSMLYQDNNRSINQAG